MQQVNLYLSELRPQRDWLDAKHAGVLVLVLAALLVVMQVILVMRESGLEQQVADQKTLAAEMLTRVEQLRSAASSANSQTLDDAIARLRAAIANREKVGQVLSGQSVGNARGFNSAMQGLARQSQGDLALTRFTFSRGGQFVELQGLASSAKAIPLYLQRLKSEEVFQQARFGLLSVNDEKTGGALVFSLGYDNVFRPNAMSKSANSTSVGASENTAGGRL